MYFETPYILDMPPLDQPYKPLSTKYANYQDYDIFALRVNLFPVLKSIRSDLTYEFEQHEMTFLTPEQGSYRDNDLKTRWFVKVDTQSNDMLIEASEVVVASENKASKNELVVAENTGLVIENKVSFTDEEINRIRDAIEEVCNDTKNNVVYVMSYDGAISAKSGKTMNKAWVNAMLPYAPYGYIQPIYHHSRGVYIILDRNSNYEAVYSRFQEQLWSWLQKEYEHGTIPWVVTERFAADWNLKPRRRFWRPMTKNHFIMGEDVIDFYLYRIKDISVSKKNNGNKDVESNSNGRYIWMSQVFYNAFEQKVFEDTLFENGMPYTVEQNCILVETSGYAEMKALVAKYTQLLDTESNRLGV